MSGERGGKGGKKFERTKGTQVGGGGLVISAKRTQGQ